MKFSRSNLWKLLSQGRVGDSLGLSCPGGIAHPAFPIFLIDNARRLLRGVGVTGPRGCYYIPPTPSVLNKAQRVGSPCRGEGHGFLSSPPQAKTRCKRHPFFEAITLGQPHKKDEQTHNGKANKQNGKGMNQTLLYWKDQN